MTYPTQVNLNEAQEMLDEIINDDPRFENRSQAIRSIIRLYYENVFKKGKGDMK